MNIPLIVGESCLKINERIREVINELEIKATRFESAEQEIIHRCIGRLEELNNQIYSQILSEFLNSMLATANIDDESNLEPAIADIFKSVSSNISKIDIEKHKEGFEIIKSLDNEETLMGLLKMVSQPEKLKELVEGLNLQN